MKVIYVALGTCATVANGANLRLGEAQRQLSISNASGPAWPWTQQNKVFGMKWGPYPTSTPIGNPSAVLNWDDVMTSGMKVLWCGEKTNCRNDLATMKGMGVSAVGTYGLGTNGDPNNPWEYDHTSFFQAMELNQLDHFPSMSDYPYTDGSAGCMTNPQLNTCYSTLETTFSDMLLKAKFMQNGRWATPIKLFGLINEPDMGKITRPGLDRPAAVTLTLLQALDALLQAEKAAGLTGNLPLITFPVTTGVTGSYVNGGASYCVQTFPDIFQDPTIFSLAPICDFIAAVQNPSSIHGYTYIPVTPLVDLQNALKTRFVASINAFMPAAQIKQHFLTPMSRLGITKDLRVYITEYNPVANGGASDFAAEITQLLSEPSVDGVFVFEFEVAQYKAGTEADFGLFFQDRTRQIVGDCTYFNCKTDQPIYCLQAYGNPSIGKPTWYESVAKAFGSKWPNYQVPSNMQGFC